MKKGTFMNEKEWLDYFETINNRKPTEEEIQQAKANGEFISQESKDFFAKSNRLKLVAILFLKGLG